MGKSELKKRLSTNLLRICKISPNIVILQEAKASLISQIDFTVEPFQVASVRGSFPWKTGREPCTFLFIRWHIRDFANIAVSFEGHKVGGRMKK